MSSSEVIIQKLLLTYNHPVLNLLRHVLFMSLLVNIFLTPLLSLFRFGPTLIFNMTFLNLKKSFFKFIRKYIPSIDKAIHKKVQESIDGLQKKLVPSNLPNTYPVLPYKGLKEASLRKELQRYAQMNDLVWKEGKVSGAVYHGNEDLLSVITEAFGMFSLTNPLHPELFQGIRQMESEVISMVLSMFNAPPDACGNITSGGTESLLMAIKTYRDLAYENKGVTEPEMIVPSTIHAAFDKAAAYFKVKMISIPVDPITGKVPVNKMKRAINRNTIMIAGSAPNFPHGIIDDIPALAALAKRYKIGMHVDACLGGFLIPFADAAGFPLPHPVDFSLVGVTSISVDTHKYGLAPKGSSVIMYRSNQLRKYQYFVTTEWPGGIYASPTISGSRPGALIAGCWAALMYNGLEGYIENTRSIISSALQLADAINELEELEVIGTPYLSVLAFVSVSPYIPIYGIAQILSEKHYHLNVLQNPPAIHMAMTLPATHGVNNLIKDIQDAVNELKMDPEKGRGDVSAIYGTVASVPDRSILEDVSAGFLDALTMMGS